MALDLLYLHTVAGLASAQGRYRVFRMTVTNTRIIVAPDGTISGQMPMDQFEPGEHEALITVATATVGLPKGKPFTMAGFPTYDIPWDGSISLRREDMYDDEGKLA